MRLAGLLEYTIDWQHLACLLYALDELGGENSRYETTEFIRAKHYLHLEAIDRTPYPTQTEERWRTDIAYARKIGVISDVVSYNARNAWGITRSGREAIRKLVAHGSELQVHRCFLWSNDFKRVFHRKFEPSELDTPRPQSWTRVLLPGEPLFAVADLLVGMDDVQTMVAKMSEELGFTVAPNRISIAFALHELQERKKKLS